MDGKYFDYTYDARNNLIEVADQDNNSCMFSQHVDSVQSGDYLTLKADVKLSGVVPQSSNGGAVIKINYSGSNWHSIYFWGDGEWPLVLTLKLSDYEKNRCSHRTVQRERHRLV